MSATMVRRQSGPQWYATREKVRRAKALRREMTPAERRLWQALRRRGVGVRARPQHVLLGWIVDFYLPAARLVIEVDGDIHDLQVDEDELRTETLRSEGLKVLRVSNDEVHDDLPAVIMLIEAHCALHDSQRPMGPPSVPTRRP
jgi:very-short-patch-repair endonuclease